MNPTLLTARRTFKHDTLEAALAAQLKVLLNQQAQYTQMVSVSRANTVRHIKTTTVFTWLNCL